MAEEVVEIQIGTEEERLTRRLTYRFLSLEYPLRLKIALDLQLIQNHDEGITAEEAFKRWLYRIKERNEVVLLEHAIDQHWPPGPFKK